MSEPELLREASDDVEKTIYDALRAYNIDRFGQSNYKALQLVLRDGEGKVTGGLIGDTSRGWLFIRLLFVPEEQRGRGLATRMLEMAEAEARTRGCIGVQIDTMSPDALALYQRFGFEIAGTLSGLSSGQDLTWLTKRLD